MFKKIMIIMAVFCVLLFSQEAYLWEIEIEAPNDTPIDARIYIAGNFNEWDPKNSDYELNKQSDNTWQINILTELKKVEFKFTLGTWASVEVDENDQTIPNRSETLSTYKHTSYQIAKWNKVHDRKNIVGNVTVINNFKMPQLNRERRIWIYLPPSYKKGLHRYPVMYMHDGQNLFSDSTSFSGEWGVDETLEKMIGEKKLREIIVVGIENSENRLSEYSPFDFEYKGLHTGEADKYAQFIVETLKPYIDKHYRTKKGRKHTAIVGSSMGGLVSVYIAIRYQEVFSRVGAMSSSFGICLEELKDYIKANPRQYSIRFWLDLGSLEGNEIENDLDQKRIIDALKYAGWKQDKEINYTLYEGAEHNESSWRERFGDVLRYMWGKQEVGSK